MRPQLIKIPETEYRSLVKKARIFDYLRNVIVYEVEEYKEREPSVEEILQWTKEAKKFAKQNKLPTLHSLKDLR